MTTKPKPKPKSRRLVRPQPLGEFIPLFHPDAIKLPADAYVSTADEPRQTPENNWQDSAGIAPTWEID